MTTADQQVHDERGPFTYRDARRLLILIVIVIAGWLLLRALVPVLLLFGIVILLAMVLNPLVVALERRRVPRPIGAALVLIALAAIVVLVVAVAVPTFTNELQSLIQRLPGAWQSIRSQIADFAGRYPALQNAVPQADQIVTTVGNQAGTMANVLLRSTLGVVGGVFVFVFSLLVLIFVLANPKPLVTGYLALIPERHRDKAQRTLIRMMDQMTAWARGVAINGVITGASTGILLWAVGVQPAFVFGVLAFFGEFLPNIGPVLVAFPVLFVALSISLTKFWLALAAILFVQQIEVNFLVPYILGREMRLNPVMILFFTVAMGWLFGLAGAILALPAAALTKIAIEEFYLRPRHVDYAPLEREAGRIVRNETAHDPLHL
ncbi:MAG TPA: AI-2E family transporter [Chthoniobacterales bacterium]|nr:AI-2E family transporter [Chthoniobacterales bacterium]